MRSSVPPRSPITLQPRWDETLLMSCNNQLLHPDQADQNTHSVPCYKDCYTNFPNREVLSLSLYSMTPLINLKCPKCMKACIYRTYSTLHVPCTSSCPVNAVVHTLLILGQHISQYAVVLSKGFESHWNFINVCVGILGLFCWLFPQLTRVYTAVFETATICKRSLWSLNNKHTVTDKCLHQ